MPVRTMTGCLHEFRKKIFFSNLRNKRNKLRHKWITSETKHLFSLVKWKAHTWKNGLHADKTILCAWISRFSEMSVTSTIWSFNSSDENIAIKFGWWLFQRKQYWSSGIFDAAPIYRIYVLIDEELIWFEKISWCDEITRGNRKYEQARRRICHLNWISPYTRCVYMCRHSKYLYDNITKHRLCYIVALWNLLFQF